MSHLSGLPNTTYSSRSNLKVSPPNPYCKFFMLITVKFAENILSV